MGGRAPDSDSPGAVRPRGRFLRFVTTLLLYGANSWASNPATDGRLQHFTNAEVRTYENAGHWLHHDQFDRFMSTLDYFL